jgi:hypothetical protein
MSSIALSVPRAAKSYPLALVGIVLVSVFVIFALFAPWIIP